MVPLLVQYDSEIKGMQGIIKRPLKDNTCDPTVHLVYGPKYHVQ